MKAARWLFLPALLFAAILLALFRLADTSAPTQEPTRPLVESSLPLDAPRAIHAEEIRPISVSSADGRFDQETDESQLDAIDREVAERWESDPESVGKWLVSTIGRADRRPLKESFALIRALFRYVPRPEQQVAQILRLPAPAPRDPEAPANPMNLVKTFSLSKLAQRRARINASSNHDLVTALARLAKSEPDLAVTRDSFKVLLMVQPRPYGAIQEALRSRTNAELFAFRDLFEISQGAPSLDGSFSPR